MEINGIFEKMENAEAQAAANISEARYYAIEYIKAAYDAELAYDLSDYKIPDGQNGWYDGCKYDYYADHIEANYGKLEVVFEDEKGHEVQRNLETMDWETLRLIAESIAKDINA